MEHKIGGNVEGQDLIERLRDRGGGDIRGCIQCGACTASCIVNELAQSFNPRKIIQMILANEGRPEFGDVWSCSTCSICVERCPQSVKPMDVMLAARWLIYEETGEISRDGINVLRSIVQRGYAFKPSKAVARRREALHLPGISLDKKALDDIRRILSDSGFHGTKAISRRPEEK